ncbi:MAG: GH1 family beta-glucosidase [Gemmatimonadota bacterium]
MTDSIRFSEGFLWGAATSAYQIEGSPLADGSGASIWHRFSHTPGLVTNGDTGDVACDHYRRWRDDVALMRELGLNAYRFSIAWSRILPEGSGRVNPAGVDFYARLVDALLEAGIRPCVTLYHWDLPASLDDRGGWLNRDVAGWFTDFATAVFRALDDRVEMWATLNEPWVVVDGGYLHGKLAPGHRSLFEAPRAAHHLLLAHGAAVEVYRAEGHHRIGIVVNLEPKHAASEDEGDRAARDRADAYMNHWFLDPALLGRYPDAMPEIFGPAWPDFPAVDLERIQQRLDFVGVNYYTRSIVCDAPVVLPPRAGRLIVPDRTHTMTGWEVYPEGLTETLVAVRDRYGDLPIYVTENGAAFYDPPVLDGDRLSDPLRVAYHRDHLRAALRAIEAGIDLRGYFAWSLLDNFEWAHGYSIRFGLVHVDYGTQRRTPKESARFYSEVIRTNGGSLRD